MYIYIYVCVCVRACEEKKLKSLNFTSSVGFQASKIWMFLKKIYYVASFEFIFWQK